MQKWTAEDLAKLKHVRIAGTPAPVKPTEDAPKKNKMGNKPVVIDGIKFQSTKEGDRYIVLSAMQRAGQITSLRWQYPIGIEVNGEHICSAVLDFAYKDDKGKAHFEDVKGRKRGVQYQIFRLKAKLLKAVKGIEVEEV